MPAWADVLAVLVVGAIQAAVVHALSTVQAAVDLGAYTTD